MATHATELGATLRAWSDRLSPTAAGLSSGHGRRATGLRREELAQLAAISVDYVVRLEQGRSIAPSMQVIAALGRALQLTNAEREHLYRLAGLAPPTDGQISDHIAPGIHRVLNRLGDIAVAVFAADWQLIWWNRGWAALVGDPVEGHRCTGKHAAPWEQGIMIWENLQDIFGLLQEGQPSEEVAKPAVLA
jgi:transcriptional regulator with XRE-family HTH domain